LELAPILSSFHGDVPPFLPFPTPLRLDKGVNAAHATQSDGFRPVAGPAKAAGSTSPRGNSANSGAAANGVKKVNFPLRQGNDFLILFFSL